MELRIGYFPVLDAALALRQAYEFVRFQPYTPAMEAIATRFSPEEKRQVEAAGETMDGWLGVIEALLAPGTAGLLGAEEGLLCLEKDPGDLAGPVPTLLAKVLRAGIAPEASRRARHLLETTTAIHQGVQKDGVWEYVLALSDRVTKARSGELVFRVKPEMRVRPDEITRIILMPSLVLGRRLAFWKRGSTLLFYVATGTPAAADDPPDSLLLSALAVGDRTRLRMLRRLAERPCTNCEMAEFLSVNPSTASRHFKLFKDAGFVEPREREGRTEYELVPEALAAALEAIITFIKDGAA